MRVWYRTPYSIERNLGKAYNEEMELIPDSDSACFIDGDVNYLIPNYGHVIQEYAEKYPNAVLTCYTNRIHEKAVSQLYPNPPGPNDMIAHINLAHELSRVRTGDPATGPVSGFLLVIPKHIWKRYKFSEVNTYRPGEPNLLGVDNEWTNRIRANGVDIIRMNGLIVYHIYRLRQGVDNKDHLR